MKEFFRGWRRKVGVVTLAVACVFMGGWMRSYFTVDVAAVNNQMILSSVGTLVWDSTPSSWMNKNGYSTRWSNTSLEPRFSYFTATQGELQSHFLHSQFDWQFQLFGIGYGKYEQGRTMHSFVAFPHWLIILGLTAIAAWLLLSQPRNSTRKNITKPVQAEGGA